MAEAKRLPWMKWYPRDWRGDGALRMCSFAARGLWADIVSVIHDEGEPYGHLLINAAAPSAAQIARILGGTAREVEGLLAELKAAGVYDVSEGGAIICRRMVRDKAKAEADRVNGKGGGNPQLTGQDKRGVNPTVDAEDKAHIPEATANSIPPNPRKRGALSAEQLSEFEGWYERYPHKVGRGAAEKAWTSARAIASLVELSEGLTRYVASKRPDVPWCNPATWLNAKRWMDAPAEPAPPKPAEVISAADRDAAKAKWNGRLAEFRDTGLWQTAWGEPPWTGNNGCFTPPWIKDAFLATRKTRQEAFALPDNLRRVPVEFDDAAALASRYEELTQRRTG